MTAVRPRALRPTVVLVAVLAALLGAGAAAEGTARADELPSRLVGVVPRGRLLTIDVGVPDLFTPEARQRLLSGFTTRILVRVYLQEAGNPKPVAVAFQRVEIVYDIWDEKFQLRFSRGPGTEREVEVATLDQAVAAATTLLQFPVGSLDALVPGRAYSIAIRGDLNPLSQELLAELRQWLRQPSGPQRRPGTGGGDSFFGTFVTVFINPQIDESEHQVRFVSQSFEGPAPAAAAAAAAATTAASVASVATTATPPSPPPRTPPATHIPHTSASKP
jgi:hypothetical protein